MVNFCLPVENLSAFGKRNYFVASPVPPIKMAMSTESKTKSKAEGAESRLRRHGNSPTPGELIGRTLSEASEVIKSVIPLTPFIYKLAQAIIDTFDSGNRVLIIGNGGSAADAQHFAAEMIVRYKENGIPLPVIALTTDTSILTAIGNDFDFDQIFARQVEAISKRGDLLLALSTSGNSRNILRAVEAAKRLSLFVVGLTGQDGGRLVPLCHLAIKVPDIATSNIQVAHIAILHAVCEVVEAQKR